MERLTMKSPIDDGVLIRQNNCGYESICFGCEKIDNCKSGCGYKKALQKLAYYEDLQEQGRLIELPCRVGYTVYVIGPENEIREHKVASISIFISEHTKGASIHLMNYRGAFIPAELCDFGKTVFLTKEEAEAELKEMEE